VGDTPLAALDLDALAASSHVALYDTTLRDGTQRQGVNLSVDDKLRVARRMDALGVHFIEGGWPGANPKDTEFFARAADGELVLDHATLVAFGMTRMAANAVEDDPLVAGLLAARTEVVCLVGKSWGYHVDEALGVPRDTNLAMVRDSVEHLVANGRRVLFDAEHFFDGYRRDRDYALEVVATAADAGAEAVVLCDTNGGTMPWEVAASSGARRRARRRGRPALPRRLRLRRRELAARHRRRGAAGAGDRERAGGAVRQREPVHHHGRPRAQGRAGARRSGAAGAR
jgi:hypothetical protein